MNWQRIVGMTPVAGGVDRGRRRERGETVKRFWIMCLVLGLLVGSVATAEAKRKPKRVQRTVKGSYGPPWVPPVTACKGIFGSWSCLDIETRSKEAYFTAKVQDAHGQPVFFAVLGKGGYIGQYCGETPDPISIDPGTSLHFRVGQDWIGPLDCPYRVKTIGTISVTLSNLR